MTQNEIISQVKSTYFQLLFCVNRLHHLQFEDSLIRNFHQAAKLKFEKGESNLLEKMNAESQQLLVQNRIREATADIHIQECHFQTLLNESRDVTIADTLLIRLSLRVPDDSSAIRANPLLDYLEQQIELSRLTRKVEHAKVLPDLFIGYFNESNKDLSANDRFTGIQAGLSIPILFSGQKGKIESARIHEEITQNELGYQSTVLKHQLHILIQEFRKYEESLDYYETIALRQADQIIRQANMSYQGGSIDYMEFVQNIRQGFGIRESYLETLNSYNQSVISIEHMINKVN
jgi:heavy metal efflux system protein